MSTRFFFVTGTDTEVGKTVVSVGLLKELAKQGEKVAGLKPVAAGCEHRSGELLNTDALALMEAASESLDYASVNPVALETAIAPHLAAQRADIALRADTLIEHCRRVASGTASVAVVEGAGGWLVPINESETLADVAVGLGAAVILVVGIRLGCLNHALLTAQAIEKSGLAMAGWVANCIDPEMPALEENIASLKAMLPAQCLGVVPWLEQAADAGTYLDIQLLDRVPS